MLDIAVIYLITGKAPCVADHEERGHKAPGVSTISAWTWDALYTRDLKYLEIICFQNSSSKEV